MNPNKIFNIFIHFFLFFIYFSFNVYSDVSIRTSTNSINSESFYIAFDFKVPVGEHITAPIGKGKSISPSINFENLEILNVYWPDNSKLKDNDGSSSGYFGYNKDFTLIYSVKAKDLTKPIKYDLFYVICGDACVPHHKSGDLKFNGLLIDDDLKDIITSNNKTDYFDFMLMIIFAIIGGIILNCMPCVFPVISIKIFSMIKNSKSDLKVIRKHSIATAIGTIFTFLSIGILLLVLMSFIPDIGWGFLMQSPYFIFLLLIVFVLCALNFFGIFSLSIPNISKIKGFNKFIKNAYVSSFFSGILGGIASASCVGPFTGVAIGSALLNTNFIQSFFIFMALGIGVSFPFILISFSPKLINIFPKPGKWLVVFKELMGFAMLFSSIWLIWILLNQIESIDVIYILICIVFMSMFLWLFSHFKDNRLIKYLSVFCFVASIYSGFNSINNNQEQNISEKIIWENYIDQNIDDLSLNKDPIFLNFTASWCLNCEFNQRVFNDKEVIKIFKDKKIKSIKCDWTKRDIKITNLLKKYNSISVPFYIYYPGNGKNFVILPSLLTKTNIMDIINNGK